ncbi:unnamed protein product [Arabidopsis lyrata]|uniref:Uncharacterized protein n=1 Tax=Arabidopsis lyrata subsp. lyrata TaxID=81972 RepID=D7KT78_ARALL|nr:uncharacterized protein LOC9325111 [Arabidopsis lyrata subsp. lyrata]EFH65307.1 hypothetical protein ARALYDRAFT_476734 [Arabidopsis lyrata subsp. lyrata]CAH8258293.1 unnamed protein product [Arabidopsis lyrata]|eukprot:XP_020865899.1 uncharacterized protein LOC9325111 [Arabidopsis lyrata subsp. lyrata]
MSRVLTCPPLVFARNQASVHNLVESTKHERITLDSKKAHRIEKKEKRIEKIGTKLPKSHKHSIKAADNHHKLVFLPSKKVSDESDQHEKSGLTEEHEEPQNHLGYLSDGSQNSKKRNRDNSPPAFDSLIKASPVAGKPLRIRLIFKKPKEEVPVLPREGLVCSTTVAKTLSHQDVITSSISASELEENLLSTSVAAAIDETKKRKKHRPSKEDQYNALFDGWTPSSICFADSSSNDNGDDWLFGNKTQEMLKPKAAVKIADDMMMKPGDSSWPRAQFLSEVGIYSLPYTVPF